MYRSPGRINIIGEHTDYNDGYVLPFAINKYITLIIKENKRFIFHSENSNQNVNIKKLEKTNTWADYIIGVLKEIEDLTKIKLPYFEFQIKSDLPIGAGLSSSAALETACAYAINDILNLQLSRKEIAEIGWRAENNFIGLKCGIMDQYACSLSRKNKALFIDTFSKKYEFVPLDLNKFDFYIIDSGVKHELGNSEYNLRRKECSTILKKLNKKSFREITHRDIEKLNGTLYKRAKHVLEENERVLKTKEALKNKEIEKIGLYLNESHESLKKLYEVSCEEIDFIVDNLRGKVNGARIVGGGFGGSVLVLSEKKKFENIIDKLKIKYKEKYEIDLKYFRIKSSNGVEKYG